MPEIIVRTDIFDYGPAFRAYKDGTTDKRKGLLCNHHFLKSLQDQGFFSDPNRTTVVADIGCGEGDTIIKYLKDIQFKGGLDIRALDADPKLVGQGDDSHNGSVTIDENAPAVHNLSKAKESQIIPLKSYRIKHGDMVQSDLRSLLYTDDELQQSKNQFDLIYFSHSMYYVLLQDKNGTSKVLDKVFTDLLSENGIAILFHSNLEADTYTSLSCNSLGMIPDIVPTEEDRKRVCMGYLIPKSCDELGLTYFEIPFKSEIYFFNNFKKYIDIYKDLNRFHEILDNDEALQDLLRLCFFCHRPLDEASEDLSSHGWTHLVDFAANLIDKYGCINVSTTMHVILGQKVSPEVKQKVEAAVKYTHANKP